MGNGAQPASLDELGKVCRRLLQPTAPASCLHCALVYHYAHSTCFDSSPPPGFSGHLWGTNADVLAPASQLRAQVSPRGCQ